MGHKKSAMYMFSSLKTAIFGGKKQNAVLSPQENFSSPACGNEFVDSPEKENLHPHEEQHCQNIDKPFQTPSTEYQTEAKVQVLYVQETQEKLAEAKVIVAKETTKLAGDKVKLESSQVTVAAEQKIFDRKAAKVKKGEGSSASLKGPASKLATAKSSMIKLQSTVNSVQQKIDDASSIVTVDKKSVLRTKKVTASKSFSQLKADLMDEATKAAEVATAAQAANHLKKLTAAQADRDFNLKHTQAIPQLRKHQS